jgi:hypothetical protein
MEVIYKGTAYMIPILSPKRIDGARLYNLATRTYIDMSLDANPTDDPQVHGYYMSLSPSETASIPQGIYNLELYSDADGGAIIEAYYENYAKVKESSFTRDYA